MQVFVKNKLSITLEAYERLFSNYFFTSFRGSENLIVVAFFLMQMQSTPLWLMLRGMLSNTLYKNHIDAILPILA